MIKITAAPSPKNPIPPKKKGGIRISEVMKASTPKSFQRSLEVKLWNVKTGMSKKEGVQKTVASSRTHGPRYISSVAWHPDNRVVLSCSCPNFVYRAEYSLWTQGGAYLKYSNGQPAHHTNPGNSPLTCLHTLAILRQYKDKVLPKIGKDPRDNGPGTVKIIKPTELKKKQDEKMEQEPQRPGVTLKQPTVSPKKPSPMLKKPEPKEVEEKEKPHSPGIKAPTVKKPQPKKTLEVTPPASPGITKPTPKTPNTPKVNERPGVKKLM